MASLHTRGCCIPSTASEVTTALLCAGCAISWRCPKKSSAKESFKLCGETTSAVTASAAQTAAWTSLCDNALVACFGARTLMPSSDTS